eukprot:TRINITY_DN2150_c0_g1_i1.p1 TRINITY_DN2150_c0_g1~~TRINITY_DN2150_c0_g1_i1.p1  ORF type:complete len:344 (-),score=73.13 TRINITY_DN2150_c0_g1_i1:110-1051(-)
MSSFFWLSLLSVSTFGLLYYCYSRGLFYNLIKGVLRRILRKSQIERAALRNDPLYAKVLFVEQSLTQSKQLQHIRKKISTSQWVVEDVVKTIADTKGIKDATRLEPIFSAIYSVSTLKSDLTELRKIQYDSQNQEHEKLLLSLWDSLLPYVKREARITKQWGDIGFQGDDPSTDFRGMGKLGLINLHYFVSVYPDKAQQVYKESQSRYSYPFSITGINLTGLLIDLLANNTLNSHFYYYGATLEQFNELYCDVFVRFSKAYIASEPVNIMEFNTIKEKFKKDLVSLLAQNKRLERYQTTTSDTNNSSSREKIE